MNRIKLITAALLIGAALAGAGENRLPELSHAAAWTVENPDKKLLEIGEVEDWLTVGTRVDQDNPCRILLKNPVDIPAGSELVWNGATNDVRELLVYMLVTDSKGTLFQFMQESHSFSKRSMFLGGRFAGGLHRVGEVRFRTKGLRAFAKQSYRSIAPANRQPVPPLKWVGLEFGSEMAKPQVTTVYFRNFQFTDATHHSPLYYQFNNQECFGAIDGNPSLSFGDILSWSGYKEKQFQLDWSARTQYDGQPFLTGSASLEIDPKAALPVALQLARRLEFPITQPGTYWITVKVRSQDGKTATVRVKEDEYRLYVINGEKQNLPPAIAPEQRIGGSTIRIGPERQSFVWGENEPWILNVTFLAAQGTVGRIEVKDKAGTVLRQTEAPASAERQEFSLDLSKLKSGVFKATATQLRNGEIVDQSVQAIGRKERLEEKAFVPPPGVPAAREVIDGEKPLFYFDAQIGNRGPDDEGKTKKVMDVVAPIARNFEVRAFWSEVETLPGVYDFRQIDALLKHAREKEIAVQLFISFGAPEWVPSHFTQNPEGEIFGHNTYLFHGARLNTFQSPVIRSAAIRFVEKLVAHFRQDPALHSYYILIEHPGEAPYKSWYEGFDPFTLANFRRAIEQKYETIQATNAAWHTQFAAFAAIMPPVFGATAANRLWLDWISFREDAVLNFKVECLREIRKLDPHRMIMVYGGGHKELSPFNVMSANGGCERPETFGHGMIQAVDCGMPQRAEEVSVTQWAADYPTRLDTSLFSMMLGGGQNSFCKMFFPTDTYLRTNSLEPLRKNPVALDRFEKFMPIWTELRSATPLAGDVRYFSDENSDRLKRKSTFHGGGDSWFTRFFLDSQVPFGVAPGKDWQQAKLLVLPNRMACLEAGVVDDLAGYVTNGGNILMTPDTGRYSVEDDAADWVLLQKFGFTPPDQLVPDVYGGVAGAPGSEFEKHGKLGTVRHLWKTAAQPGFPLALFDSKTTGPLSAVTVHDFGKGKVFVIWAQEVQPPGNHSEHDYPLLRAVAAKCAADLPVACDSRYFWTNLMKDRKSDTWYLLVMRSTAGNDDANSATLKPTLPPGNYRLTELINGQVDSAKSAEQLAGEGLPVRLGKREVAIYKLQNSRNRTN